jgi:OOP family OmpA-OmpF porin
MQISDKPILRGIILSHSVLALLALGLAGCGPTVFAGKTPMSIGGDLPAPPPPPPPPEPPPEPPKRVELKQDKIQINEKVQFEYNSSKILEESHSLLDEVASVIKENDFIKKIQVEGHASSDGADDYNMRLSDARAKAVREYLVGAGVPADKLVAKGFGETKPIVSNDTEEGRQQNRRVEFNILEQDLAARQAKADAGAEEGDAAAEEGEEEEEEAEEEAEE